MIAKAAGLKLVKTNKTFREQAEVSISRKLSKHQVIDADEKVMTIVLKGKQSDHLGTMIYQRFQELVTTRGKRPSTPRCCHQSVLQRSTTASESSIRSNSGKGEYFADWRFGLGALWNNRKTYHFVFQRLIISGKRPGQCSDP